ncbi:SCY1 2 [Pelomyxa schiedti]|nr:SCY1 2 [Pelomyxa schiedti]
MGNLAFKDYEVVSQVGSGGCACCWKICDAVKKSTKEEVSLFIFEKKMLEKYPKSVQESVLTTLRKGCQMASRLHHPLILKSNTKGGYDESKEHIVVETERVKMSLANVQKNFSNIQPVPEQLQSVDFSPLELKIGILNVLEAMMFLHSQAQLIHLGLSPECVFITNDSKWKLGSFSFSVISGYKPGEANFSWKELDNKEIFPLNPCLDYAAPETVFLKRSTFSSDLFSLGCMIWELYNIKKVMASPTKESESSHLMRNYNNLLRYKQNIERVHPLDVANIPDNLQAPLAQLLHADPDHRLPLRGFAESPFFSSDILLQSLSFVADINSKDDPTKTRFLKGFSKIIVQYPLSLLKSNILPPLSREILNRTARTFVLENLLTLTTMFTPRDFTTYIMPILQPVLISSDISDSLLVLCNNIPTLASKMTPQMLNNYLIRMVETALSSNETAVLISVLQQIPPLMNSMEYGNIKTKIVPKIQALCKIASLNHNVLVCALQCLSMLLPLLDKTWICDNIIPILQSAITSHANSSKAVMASVGVCVGAVKLLGVEFAAKQVLPFLVPFLVNPSLTSKQFSVFFSSLRDMLTEIEKERLAFFENADKLSQAQSTQIEQQQFQQIVQTEFKQDKSRDSPSVPMRHDSIKPPDEEDVALFKDLVMRQQNRSWMDFYTPSEAVAPVLQPTPLNPEQTATSAMTPIQPQSPSQVPSSPPLTQPIQPMHSTALPATQLMQPPVQIQLGPTPIQSSVGSMSSPYGYAQPTLSSSSSMLLPSTQPLVSTQSVTSSPSMTLPPFMTLPPQQPSVALTPTTLVPTSTLTLKDKPAPSQPTPSASIPLQNPLGAASGPSALGDGSRPMIPDPKTGIWIEIPDTQSGKSYFWNTATNQTSWERPAASVPLSTLSPVVSGQGGLQIVLGSGGSPQGTPPAYSSAALQPQQQTAPPLTTTPINRTIDTPSLSLPQIPAATATTPSSTPMMLLPTPTPTPTQIPTLPPPNSTSTSTFPAFPTPTPTISLTPKPLPQPAPITPTSSVSPLQNPSSGWSDFFSAETFQQPAATSTTTTSAAASTSTTSNPKSLISF